MRRRFTMTANSQKSQFQRPRRHKIRSTSPPPWWNTETTRNCNCSWSSPVHPWSITTKAVTLRKFLLVQIVEARRSETPEQATSPWKQTRCTWQMHRQKRNLRRRPRSVIHLPPPSNRQIHSHFVPFWTPKIERQGVSCLVVQSKTPSTIDTSNKSIQYNENPKLTMQKEKKKKRDYRCHFFVTILLKLPQLSPLLCLQVILVGGRGSILGDPNRQGASKDRGKCYRNDRFARHSST